MDISTLLIIIVIAIFVVFFGKILSHALRFVFYIMLIALVLIFIFGVSFSDLVGFVQNLVFTTF